ncbi:ATP-binding protein [Paenibacillus tengchongensis]|uniref:ATP-binding protein n=1 Tax=Paenibacillus tengchongensis TaxID=2608684 RepID=UPI001C9E9B43|nr:AAA family ATPase [Paenibacillus tengchongensis]
MKLKRQSKWFGQPVIEKVTGTEVHPTLAVNQPESAEMREETVVATEVHQQEELIAPEQTADAKPVHPYTANAEYLSDELRLLDLRLRYYRASAGNGEQTLIDEEIIALLGGDASQTETAQGLASSITSLDRNISERLALSREAGVKLMLPHIASKLKLSVLERNCLIACLAPELDRKYERVYACLQNDLSARGPAVELILSLFAESGEEQLAARLSFERTAPLMHDLLDRTGEYGDSRVPLIARPLKLEDWSVSALLGFETLDGRLAPAARLYPADTIPVTTEESDMQVRQMLRFVNRQHAGAEGWPGTLLYCSGGDEAEKLAAAGTVCKRLGAALLVADAGKLLLENGYPELLRLIGRHALLHHTALLFTSFDALTAEDDRYNPQIRLLLQTLGERAPLTFILGEAAWRENLTEIPLHFMQVDFPLPDAAARRKAWQSYASGHTLSEAVDLADLSGAFRFSRGQIRAALRGGEDLAVWNGSASGEIGVKELYQACYQQSGRTIRTLANKIDAVYTWDMLVLPHEAMGQLREICNQVKYRPLVYGEWGFAGRLSLGKGLNILFSGPPGAGKTMAAEVIATELNLEMYKVDVSQIVSKYIGETEKNLSRIFDEAETSNAILFFDEADALFGKRSEVKDAHDRYANVEISYLLQKMEEYSGIVILATNLNQNLDDAFLRRLNFKLEFPFPEKEQREQIWRGMFPAGAPVDDTVDYKFIADKFALAGGNIKNIALNAAFYAAHEGCPIGMKQIMLAAKREYRKLGRTFLQSDYAPYHQLIEVN